MVTRLMLARLPLLVVLATVVAGSMYVPALHALARDAHREAQAFFYWGTIMLAFCAATGLATSRRRPTNQARSHLLALVGAFTILPAMAAVPFREVVADTRPVNAYVEMVAAMTTTGGSLFTGDRLSASVHLWRALLGWQGGLLMLVAAVAILAPLQLGGIDLSDRNAAARTGDRLRRLEASTPGVRLWRALQSVLPVYGVLTVALALLLAAMGEAPTRAAIHAMSTLSTSGIHDGPGIQGSTLGILPEIAVAALLLFALSRRLMTGSTQIATILDNRELRVAGLIVLGVTGALFARHWIAAFDVDAIDDGVAALDALWGAAFTTLSFLTTTGWISESWTEAQTWSGLGAPAVLLLGLAMFGGGVATTAGGVKLLRIYALYTHGRHEMNLLVHPSAVSRRRGAIATIPPGGIEAAWVFFMLFATSIAVVTLALTATGLSFEAAIVLAVAALTTTGPLADTALGGLAAFGSLEDSAKIIAAVAMVVGRLEALGLIALLSPTFWRD